MKKNCEFCGKIVEDSDSDSSNKVFCSSKCEIEAEKTFSFVEEDDDTFLFI